MLGADEERLNAVFDACLCSKSAILDSLRIRQQSALQQRHAAGSLRQRHAAGSIGRIWCLGCHLTILCDPVRPDVLPQLCWLESMAMKL